jgi:Transcription factor WhiB
MPPPAKWARSRDYLPQAGPHAPLQAPPPHQDRRATDRGTGTRRSRPAACPQVDGQDLNAPRPRLHGTVLRLPAAPGRPGSTGPGADGAGPHPGPGRPVGAGACLHVGEKTQAEGRSKLSWRRKAACIGTPPEDYFPMPLDHATRAAAQAVCARCEVPAECLAEARERGDRHGVRGGIDLELEPRPALVAAEVSGAGVPG